MRVFRVLLTEYFTAQYSSRTEIRTRQRDVGLVNLASWNLPRLEHPGPSLSLYDNQVLGRVLPRCELCELHVDSNSVTSGL
jgi:hypothetical protein